MNGGLALPRLGPPYGLSTWRSLLLLDRQALGADIDAHALGLLAVLIELIAQDGDNNHQRADDEKDDVAAIQNCAPIAACITRGAAKSADALAVMLRDGGSGIGTTRPFGIELHAQKI